MIPHSYEHYIRDKVFKRGLSKFCGRQPLKNFKGYGLLKQTILQYLTDPFLNTLSHIQCWYECGIIFFMDSVLFKIWICLENKEKVMMAKTYTEKELP